MVIMGNKEDRKGRMAPESSRALLAPIPKGG